MHSLKLYKNILHSFSSNPGSAIHKLAMLTANIITSLNRSTANRKALKVCFYLKLYVLSAIQKQPTALTNIVFDAHL